MRIYRIFVEIVAVIAIIILILLLGVRLFGLTPYTVLSGSMEPNYHVGSVIYVKSAEANEIIVGDPITFDLNGVTVTHRVIEKIDNANGISFRTQGDANNTPDGGFVTPDEIIGVPQFHIPYLGYVFDYVQHPPGLYIVIGVIALLVILSFLQPEGEEKGKDEASATEEKKPNEAQQNDQQN